MAKGQKHSNKEVRKPKSDKASKAGGTDSPVTAAFAKTISAAHPGSKKKDAAHH
jgi:hypothetical protein